MSVTFLGLLYCKSINEKSVRRKIEVKAGNSERWTLMQLIGKVVEKLTNFV